MDSTCVFNFFTFFERILYKSNCIIFIFSLRATHTKIWSKLVVIVTAGSQKITPWGPQRTPLGILRVNPIHCLHTVANVDWKDSLSAAKNTITAHCWNRLSLQPFHFDWHWAGVMDSCGFKVMYGGWERSRGCVEPVLSSFHYSNNKKKMTRKGKSFSSSSFLARV